MKIKTKLFYVFLILFLSMILLLSYSIYTIRHLNRSIDEIVNQQYKKVELATSVRDEVNNIVKALRNYALADSASLRQENLDKINMARDSGGKALLNLEKVTKDEQGILIINHLKSTSIEYLQFQQAALKKIQEGSIAEASKMISEDGQKYQQNLFNQVDDLVNINKLSMQQAVQNSSQIYNRSILYLLISTFLFFLLGAVLTSLITRKLTVGLAKVSNVMEGFSKGTVDLGTRLEVESKDEIGVVSIAFNQMASSLESQASREKVWSMQLEESAWLHSKMNKLFTAIQEIDDIKAAAEGTLLEIMPHLGVAFGVIYIKMNHAQDYSAGFERMASYATNEIELVTQKQTVMLGEGLIGQCALEQRIIELSDVPPEYFQIQSGLGSLAPRHILIIPLVVGPITKGVIELASLHKFSTIQMEFLTQMTTLLAIHINKIKNKNQIELLFAESQLASKALQEQSEELLQQQEELAQMNAELEEHTAALEESEHQLQIQQADLENMNEELREKSRKLEEQNLLYQAQNRSLEVTTSNLEKKTLELTDAISYKSVFLANMSHELRTPLNSMLILAKHLADNKEKNLSAKQVEYALTVYSSGRDLLLLINEILELAKVESQKVIIQIERVELQEVLGFVQRNFDPIAQQKALQFHIQIDSSAPKAFYTDQQRLLQILQNLLSNAFKFTEQGSVTFSVATNLHSNKLYLKPNQKVIEFSVTDTGIGIERDKQEIVFDAFVQADGTTNRKYGGTGLGLSISREITNLLGGEIHLQSIYGEGSTFTLLIPVEVESVERIASSEAEEIHEQNHNTEPKPISQKLDDRTILLVDDDIRNVFALSSVLESYGLTVLYAENGREAIDVLDRNEGIDAILMDIMMPEMDGYEATKRIRNNPKYRDLPILAVTAKAMKDDREKCMKAGASDYITKPVDVDQLLSLLKVWLYT
jgi:two-component system, chemotaxis family, sensor kinase CheA